MVCKAWSPASRDPICWRLPVQRAREDHIAAQPPNEPMWHWWVRQLEGSCTYLSKLYPHVCWPNRTTLRRMRVAERREIRALQNRLQSQDPKEYLNYIGGWLSKQKSDPMAAGKLPTHLGKRLSIPILVEIIQSIDTNYPASDNHYWNL